MCTKRIDEVEAAFGRKTSEASKRKARNGRKMTGRTVSFQKPNFYVARKIINQLDECVFIYFLL